MTKITTQNLVDMAKDLIEARYKKEGHHSVLAATFLANNISFRCESDNNLTSNCSFIPDYIMVK